MRNREISSTEGARGSERSVRRGCRALGVTGVILASSAALAACENPDASAERTGDPVVTESTRKDPDRVQLAVSGESLDTTLQMLGAVPDFIDEVFDENERMIFGEGDIGRGITSSWHVYDEEADIGVSLVVYNDSDPSQPVEIQLMDVQLSDTQSTRSHYTSQDGKQYRYTDIVLNSDLPESSYADGLSVVKDALTNTDNIDSVNVYYKVNDARLPVSYEDAVNGYRHIIDDQLN